MNAATELLPLSAGECVRWAESWLVSVSDSPRLEAELLLAECIGVSRTSVIAHPERPLAPDESKRFAEHVNRRSRGEPFAHITGSREFFGLQLRVTPDVLVPRPETEQLVELVLAQQPAAGASVLDPGTGSGAIALALKSQRPDLVVTAVDCSKPALAVAQGNAAALALDVRFVHSDWYAALADERFDLIVSNPPYVGSDDPHFSTGLGHEPRLALDGGADGLDAYRRLLQGAGKHLAADGLLAFEHGFDQRDALVGLAVQSGFDVDAAADDLAGHPRAIVFARSRYD